MDFKGKCICNIIENYIKESDNRFNEIDNAINDIRRGDLDILNERIRRLEGCLAAIVRHKGEWDLIESIIERINMIEYN